MDSFIVWKKVGDTQQGEMHEYEQYKQQLNYCCFLGIMSTSINLFSKMMVHTIKVMVTIIENGPGNPSSNPGKGIFI